MFRLQFFSRRCFSVANPKKIVYKIAEKSNKVDIAKFLSWNFRTNEPVCEAIGLSVSDSEALYDCLVDESLEYPVSVLAFDEEASSESDTGTYSTYIQYVRSMTQ